MMMMTTTTTTTTTMMMMMMFIDVVFLSLLDTAGLSARTSGSCCTRCGGRGGPQNPWSDLCQSFVFASMVHLLFKYSSRFVYLLFFALLVTSLGVLMLIGFQWLNLALDLQPLCHRILFPTPWWHPRMCKAWKFKIHIYLEHEKPPSFDHDKFQLARHTHTHNSSFVDVSWTILVYITRP